MSGGRFDYRQLYIGEIADSIEEYLDGREIDEDDVEDYISTKFLSDEEIAYIRKRHHTIPNYYGYGKDTIRELRKGLKLLRKAYIYAQRIDWLLSSDDGEESFHERLKEELNKMKK